jgi:hypothetical protein
MRYAALVVLFFAIFSCERPNEEVKQEVPKPSGNCLYTKDEKDPLGRKNRMVEDQKFISLEFSDSIARALYKNEEYFKGYLSCMSVDSILGIYFSFKVRSDDAFEHYGMIVKGNKISFILKSGKTVDLPFGATFSGNTDLSKDFTEYSSFAYLTSDDAEQLKGEELGRVKISWSKKEEEYVVVNPSVFINQLPCIQ